MTLDPTELKADTIDMEDGTRCLFLSASGINYTGDTGEPRIPCKSLNFLVPAYSNGYSVRLENIRTGEALPTHIPLYTNQPSDEDKNADDIHPISPLQISEVSGVVPKVMSDFFVNGDSHVVSVAIPMAWVDEEVSPIISADVVVSYTACGADEMTSFPLSSPKSELDTDLSRIVVNCPKNLRSTPGEIELVGERKKYCYILVPESLKDAIADMVAWKTQKGLKVVVRTVEEIDANPAYAEFTNGGVTSVAVDKESRIRNWLRSEYARTGAFQLLIIGNDFTSAPVRKFYKGDLKYPINGSFASPNFIYSDLYFSDMNTEFKLTQIPEGQYTSESSGFTYNPTLPAGRLLVRDKKEIDTYFQKLLIYQLDPGLGDPSYLDSGLLVEVFDVYEDDKNNHKLSVVESMDGLADITVFRDSIPSDSYALSRPTGKQIINIMRDCGLISLQGHGSPYSIEVSGQHTIIRENKLEDNWKECRYIKPLSSSPMKEEWGFSNVEEGNAYDDLKNYGKPSVIYSIGCSTSPYGRIEHETGYKNVYYNINTAYLFAGYFGGVAFVGTSDACKIWDCNIQEHNFGAQLNDNPNLGQSLVETKTSLGYMINSNCVVSRNLHGDPDIDVWTHGAPTHMMTAASTDFSTVLFCGEQTNATIAFYDGKGQSKRFFAPLLKDHFTMNKDKWDFITDRDFMVSIFRQDKFPVTQLFASGSNLKNVSKKYFVNQEIISDCLGQDNYAFNVGFNGKLEITATRKIATSKGFDITDGGEVVLTSLGKAELKDDCVEKGGNLTVDAASVSLQSGFEVKKGGTLFVSTKNN